MYMVPREFGAFPGSKASQNCISETHQDGKAIMFPFIDARHPEASQQNERRAGVCETTSGQKKRVI